MALNPIHACMPLITETMTCQTFCFNAGMQPVTAILCSQIIVLSLTFTV